MNVALQHRDGGAEIAAADVEHAERRQSNDKAVEVLDRLGNPNSLFGHKTGLDEPSAFNQ